MKLRSLSSRLLTLLFLSGLAYSGISGILYFHNPPAGYTGAPGENNCTYCHSGALNPVPANLSNMSLTGNFSGGGYLPDSTYTITLSYSQSGITRYGFQVTSLRKSNNEPVGTFYSGSGITKSTLSVAGKTRQYVQQTSSNTSGTWSFTWKAPSENVDSISFYATVNASNSNSQDNGDQVYTRVFRIGPSSLLPKAFISTSKTTVCVGQPVTYFGSGTNNPVSYRWKFQSGSPQIVTTQNVTRTYSQSGVYFDTLWVTNDKGVSLPARKIMVVADFPTASITGVNPSNTVCEGDTITLTAAAGAGYSYSWNTNPNDNGQSVEILQAGQYAVTVTNSSGCSRTSPPVNLTFNTGPPFHIQASVSQDTSCYGDTLVVTADGSFQEYLFYDKGILKQTGPANIFRVWDTGYHVITAKANNGQCNGNSQETISRYILFPDPGPVLYCGNKTTDELNFHWNKVNGASGYEVSVNDGPYSQVGTDTFYKVSGLTFNTIVNLKVRALVNGLCNHTRAGSLNCITLPCSPFTYFLELSQDTVCLGDTLTAYVKDLSLDSFEIRFLNEAFGPDTFYRWVPLAGGIRELDIAIHDLKSLSCPIFTTKDTAFVEEKKNLVNGIRTTQICPGDTLSLHASENGSMLSFYRNGQVVQQGNDPYYLYMGLTQGDEIRYTSRGYSCLSESPLITISEYPAIVAGFGVEGEHNTYTFRDSTLGSVSRIWDFNDLTPLDTHKVVTHTFPDTGYFAVRLMVMSVDGCTDSFSRSVRSYNLGIHGVFQTRYSLYPNPSLGRLFVEKEDAAPLYLRVFDNSGRLVREEEVRGERSVLNFWELKPGIYQIEVRYHEGVSRHRIVFSN